jgi:Txe/YoeB family toxin of Txe-Axe toxin-antitoxin module
MKITEYSKRRILQTFSLWRVERDFADPMYNYLVHGFEPGSCFTGVLANDFFGAITRSHPSNTVEALKSLAKWVQDTVPREARGSYEAVKYWTNLTEDLRRRILEEHRLIYTSEEEVWMTLTDAKSEPLTEYYNV